MARENSVDFYTTGVIRMNIHFPNGMADCRHCRFCRFREAFNTYQCSLTDDFMEKYDLDMRHPNCPVELHDTPF